MMQVIICMVNYFLNYAESRTDRDLSVSNYLITRNHSSYPVDARSAAVDRFQELVEDELCSLQRQVGDDVPATNDNLTKAQRISLNQLKKQVDKGGTVTILDMGLYIYIYAQKIFC